MRLRMDRFSKVALTALAVLLYSGVANAQWSDNFDAYGTGPIAGQGGWDGWDQAASADADVSDEQAVSAPNSLRLRTGSDIVQVYRGYAGGQWVYRAMTFIPTDHSGETYFILLNTYNHGGAKNWSTQVVIRNGQVESLGGSGFGGGGTLPAIQGEWVEMKVEIDLDANTQIISYGGQVLDQTPWTASGILEVQAVDLFSNNGSPAYFDDLSLAQPGPPPVEAPALSVWGACCLTLATLLAGVVVLYRRSSRACFDH